MKKLLNLGCGERFHGDWTNVDFTSSGGGVLAHNLLKGIPFPDETFDVVYHSHVLEHFSKTDGERFIKECYRVLKPGGIIRIAVPNLEEIVNNYKKYLELSLSEDPSAINRYDWSMMELFDQTVRTEGGGEIGKFITADTIPEEDFVRSRIGYFYNMIRDQRIPPAPKTLFRKIKDQIKSLRNKCFKNYVTGKFRNSGEVHLWMYDRFSLGRLLTQSGFKNPIVRTAAESAIPNWTSYNLDTQADGEVYKPDSLFMEAVK